MIKRGIANLPLHGGACPKWLFPRMKKLSGAISETIIHEFGTQEYFKRLADPYFLQALGSVIGFDWHSSGLTVTTLGALKASVNNKELGIKFAGGKGRTSRKTPQQIKLFSQEFNLSTRKIEQLIYNSKLSAKVDNNMLQDGYQLYHHSFVFDEQANWVIIQQGMNTNNLYARRYHWTSTSAQKFIEEPHNAICCNLKDRQTLDLTSKHNQHINKTSLDLVNDDIEHLNKYFNTKIEHKFQKTLDQFNAPNTNKTITKTKTFSMPKRHTIINMNKRNLETLKIAHEYQPKSFEELIALKGVGAKTIRSLALISELIYGNEITWKDPVKHSFALGGKDKIPYEIDTKQYDRTIEILETAVENAKIDQKARLIGIKKLASMYS